MVANLFLDPKAELLDYLLFPRVKAPLTLNTALGNPEVARFSARRDVEPRGTCFLPNPSSEAASPWVRAGESGSAADSALQVPVPPSHLLAEFLLPDGLA